MNASPAEYKRLRRISVTNDMIEEINKSLKENAKSKLF